MFFASFNCWLPKFINYEQISQTHTKFWCRCCCYFSLYFSQLKYYFFYYFSRKFQRRLHIERRCQLIVVSCLYFINLFVLYRFEQTRKSFKTKYICTHCWKELKNIHMIIDHLLFCFFFVENLTYFNYKNKL